MGTTSNHHAPYVLGYTRNTMAINKEKQYREVEQNYKNGLSSDCRLQPACTKLESLVIANQHVAVNTFPGLVHLSLIHISGGQKQRLCIARALLKKPKILILDDSTSAVDTATDAKIRKAFLEEIPATTKLIIAQRISSVQDADRIIVMDDGKVNGIGTHEELLKSNEIYREVYESQTGGGGDFDEKRGEA